MASQTVSPAPAPGAQVVGHAFVEQYYHILHRSPESVHKFYQDSSVISRPEPNGVMTSVTTMHAINDKILSLDYKNFKAELKTADAQESHEGGVIVLVTGCLTGMDNVRRPFAQSFFLAPQEKGYYVLNDVFRYLDESDTAETSSIVASGVIETAPSAPQTPDPEPVPAVDHHATFISGEYHNNDVEVCDPSDNEEGSVVEEEVVEDTAAHSSQNEMQQVSSTSVQDDTPKKSYASIVKVMKTVAAPTAVYVPTTNVWATPTKPEQQSLVSPASVPEVETPATGSNGGHENSIHHKAGSRSIYIRGMPLNAEVAQVEEEFRKFGPIKPGGVQVRSNWQQGFCFGFVEYESSSSMRSAIEASPIMIGGCQAFIEEKRNTSFRGNGGGRVRFPPGRGGFRNENFRGRENFGNRGYGRNDFGNRGEFSGRGQGPSSRGSDAYQRVDQNMSGRVSRSGGMNQNAVSDA